MTEHPTQRSAPLRPATLRPATIADAAGIAAVLRDLGWFAHIGEEPPAATEARVAEQLARCVAEDLRRRTDRSILYELSDAELEELVAYIGERVPSGGPIADTSRWTLWWGTKAS